MPASTPIVTIFGGSGFVGRYIARRMALEGWRVRVAVRRPNEANFVRTYGTVGQVEPVAANIRDEASTRAAVRGADAVVNCVAILREDRHQKFEDLHVAAAGRIAQCAAEEGVGRLVQISAIGANAESRCNYARSKAQGEDQAKAHFADVVIIRPSLIFGQEDKLFNRFATMAQFGPVIPLFGGKSLFQPVYVDDVAKVAAAAALGNVEPGVYELGGPDQVTLEQMMERMLKAIRRRRLVVNLPFFLGFAMGYSLDLASRLTRGYLPNNVLTADQVRQLRQDNVVSGDAKGFAELGIEPTAMDAVLDEYLYRHRPYGQYAEVTESARNLKS